MPPFDGGVPVNKRLERLDCSCVRMHSEADEMMHSSWGAGLEKLNRRSPWLPLLRGMFHGRAQGDSSPRYSGSQTFASAMATSY